MSSTKKETKSNITEVTPKQAVPLIKLCIDAGRPAMIWGAPGIGKSDLIAAIAAMYDKPRPVIDIRLLLCDPTDLRGIPFVNTKEGRMELSDPIDLPMTVTKTDLDLAKKDYEAKKAAFESYSGGDNIQQSSLEDTMNIAKRHLGRLEHDFQYQDAILFLDEMVSAPQTVQGAAYQLILNRRIGSYHLPPGIGIVAAGNRETDRGVSFQMPKPLQNRFIHLNMRESFQDWQEWAIENQVEAEVVGFLSANPHELFDFDPKSASKAFPTPRSWKFVSDLLKKSRMPVESIYPLIAGTVGDGVAYKFISHLKVAGKMPNPMDILTGKEKDLKVKDISAKYSLIVSLCYMLKEKYEVAQSAKGDKTATFTSKEWNGMYDFFLGYLLKNMEEELVVLAVKSSFQTFNMNVDFDLLTNFPEFQKKYGKLIINA
jgi:MoxR-like ATPase